jgi:hypothetical protein
MIPRMVPFLVALLAATSADAQVCDSNIRETTPTSRFVVNVQQGTVLDKSSGLMWKQCAEGMSGHSCTTSTGAYPYLGWSEALTQAQAANSTHAGYKDWRLPNIKELESLVEEKCHFPSINLTVFPNTAPTDWYWSSTPDATNAGYTWVIHFDYGYSGSDNRMGNFGIVRLVRGGQ